MTLERDNLKAGIFVLAGIIIALIFVFMLSNIDSWFVKTQRIKVAYALGDGLKGLKIGATVTLGDTPIGQVVNIADKKKPGTRQVIGKVVTAEIPTSIPIFQNAVFELAAPPLGSGTKLNIRNVGAGQPYAPKTHIDGSIASSQLANDFVKQMGIEEHQRQRIRKIIDNVAKITTELSDAAPQVTDDLRLLISDLRKASQDIKMILADINSRRTEWFSHMDNITANADEVITDARDLIHDKAPAMRQTIDNMHDITHELRTRTLDQVTKALAKADTAVDNVKMVSTDLKAFVTGQRPVLERAIANAQLTTDQLKLAAIEVRRSPWRLLYQPDDRELETDNLYDAARSFALAAGTLDSATRSLRTVAEKQPDNTAEIEKMLDYLEQLFSKFEQAESAFWKALKEAPPTR